MSMLAEPRRKQKWSVDPRNSAWSNDDSKFGQKMLERMGWSKGKGLGRSEQGSTDHIKVKVKNNNYGLGANASHEDNWIAHQDEFNELLAQLNNHHAQNSDAPSDEKKGFSLEEKSKTSKKRVHYMKFTKGKDLSSRSETDLNCIFGKRAKSANDQEQESSKNNSSDESEESRTPPPEPDTEFVSKTVTSSLSMQEYFAQRMAQLKKARGAQSTAPSAAEVTETGGPAEELSPVDVSNDDAEEPKKKKKKDKKLVEVVEVVDDKSQEKESSRKKKKRKITEHDCSSTNVPEENCQELRSSKKKKLKKRPKDGELLNGHGPAQDETVECELMQAENHKEDDVGEEWNEEPVVKKSKKKKRKKEHRK
ncbi:PIN2/TERF1-interacting telomerase inhibitor 1 [Kryptolebias marmoratus]|uniref:PIN2 (TERF1) interacting telomerase inhibitor 1 n=1 Tax=Kryptolebias marmoratus TaxID=37003 RepID=A0A3Q3AKT4_KRYMA|nr:PIN2/TERF1-interacting telomerase inhibitor 1 [Kryptolebias marmoratus]